jgi:hypothetical protein
MQVLVKRNESYILKIFDILGRELTSYAAPDNPQTIDVTGFAAGTYFLVIQYESGGIDSESIIIRN